MTDDECRKIALRISLAAPYPWSAEKLNEFAKVLAASTIGGVAFEIVSDTLTRLLGEAEPERVTIARLIESVKTAPVLPKRRYLPPPEDGSGTAERPIYFPPNSGKEQFPVAQPDEEERERMRVFYAGAALPATVINRRDLGIRQEHIDEAERRRKKPVEHQANPKRRAELAHLLASLGSRMKLRCIRCRGDFTQVDIDAYVLRLMDAGREGDPEPPRWCLHCTPGTPPPSIADEEVPF